MDRDEIRAQVLGLPEVNAWPEMANLFERAVSVPRRDWEWPALACQAVGGDSSVVVPGAAAIACMQLSITLIDDMLDEDPRGAHLQLGQAATANLAAAFQAAAFRLIANTPIEPQWRAPVMDSLAQLALGTAFGQNLDVQNLSGEANYWRIVRAKSTPFYGATLQIGALLGKASPQVAEHLHEYGILSGEVVQIYDDLTDALKKPANPDWKQGRLNLLILYASTADHADRSRFRALLPQIDDLGALEEAQQILIRCGAVSYCAYHVIKRYHTARQLLDTTPLVDPLPLRGLLAQEIQPLTTLFRTVGAELPPEFETI